MIDLNSIDPSFAALFLTLLGGLGLLTLGAERASQGASQLIEAFSSFATNILQGLWTMLQGMALLIVLGILLFLAFRHFLGF